MTLAALAAPFERAMTDLAILKRLTEHHLVQSEEYRALVDAIEEVLKLRAAAKQKQTDRERISAALTAANREFTALDSADTLIVYGHDPGTFDLCTRRADAIVEFNDAGALIDIFTIH